MVNSAFFTYPQMPLQSLEDYMTNVRRLVVIFVRCRKIGEIHQWLDQSKRDWGIRVPRDVFYDDAGHYPQANATHRRCDLCKRERYPTRQLLCCFHTHWWACDWWHGDFNTTLNFYQDVLVNSFTEQWWSSVSSWLTYTKHTFKFNIVVNVEHFDKVFVKDWWKTFCYLILTNWRALMTKTALKTYLSIQTMCSWLPCNICSWMWFISHKTGLV